MMSATMLKVVWVLLNLTFSVCFFNLLTSLACIPSAGRRSGNYGGTYIPGGISRPTAEMIGALPQAGDEGSTLNKRYAVAYNDRAFNGLGQGGGFSAGSVLHGQPY